MAEEVVTRRRVLRDDPGVVREDVDDGVGAGLGTALAVILAVIAVLAIFALVRGVFSPAPATSPTPTGVQVQPGTTVR